MKDLISIPIVSVLLVPLGVVLVLQIVLVNLVTRDTPYLILQSRQLKCVLLVHPLV